MSALVWSFEKIDGLGHRVLTVLKYTASVFSMIYLALRAAIFDQAQGMRTVFSVVSAQIYFTAWQAIPLISLLAIASGGVVIMQSSSQLSLIGGGAMLGNLMVAVIVRELAPLITALIVISRSGTAVASELGTMKVNREVEALEIMGINPLSYIVFPRLVGGIISVFCLAIYFTGIALLGGFLVTSFLQNISFYFYLDQLANAVTAKDVFLFALKNLFSGSIIFTVSCYQGLRVQQSLHEVPQVTMKAVVNSILYVVGFNMTVTTLVYMQKLIELGVI
jgi:phospholipid/cholesterol/gamma-HCH transport system permease protein